MNAILFILSVSSFGSVRLGFESIIHDNSFLLFDYLNQTKLFNSIFLFCMIIFPSGKTNKEFNMRHDWNSLISDNDDLLITKYSKEFFPPADTLVRKIAIFKINTINRSDNHY